MFKRTTRAPAQGLVRWLLVGVPALLAFVVLLRRPLKLRDRIRLFNKYVYNRLTLTFAGQAGRPYTVIRHVGRRTGKVYETPVVSDQTPTGFVVPLFYGTDVDWLRNVLAAGKFTLVRQGVEHEVGEPEVVDLSEVLPTVSTSKRVIYRIVGIRHFLRVRTLGDVMTQPT